MSPRDEAWTDDEPDLLVRPYTVTGGRTKSNDFGLDLLTLVVAVSSAGEARELPAEYAQIVRMCQVPISVAEIGAHLDLPLPVVKVLLGDLIERNYVIYRTAARTSETPNKHVLQAVLDGIRKL